MRRKCDQRACLGIAYLSVVGLFKINESSVQPERVAWLYGAGSVLQVLEDEQGL